MKNKFTKIMAVLLALLIVVSLAVPAFATGDSDTVYINHADDLLELAKNCRLDTWSHGKTVVLQADISLNDVPFLPIPTFGGTFDGQGHTISGLDITDSVTPAGLFSILQESAVVQNLKVSGTVAPSGVAVDVGGIAGKNYGTIEGCSFTGNITGTDNVGGIAGVNTASGTVRSCGANGSVTGENMTGGIVGYNLGTVEACENRAYVNTTSVDPAISPDDINLEFSMDLSMIGSLDTSNAATDTGGIAGYSSGTIRSCTNYSTVGYPHIGYNIGGIVGRNCGFVDSCANEADIYGRKDVGGIVGQIEPDVILVLSEDHLETLSEQLQELSELVQDVGDSAGGAGGAIQGNISAMKSYIGSAQSAIASLKPSKEPSLPDLGAINQLVTAVRGMRDVAGQMVDSVSSGTGAVVSSVTAVSDQVGAIAETVSAIVDGAKQAPIVDSSDTSIEEVTQGKVFGCVNSGKIRADINVGGIVGTMALEYEVDPEDDLTAEITGTQRRNYEMKAVVQSCINLGEVIAKKNCAGGICGRMDLGLITDSEGYGDTSSESGDYVGGIAGLTGGTVRRCFAKCTLSGDSYIGGIVGSGITEDISGAASIVENCYSMVIISDSKEYAGAVSGADAGLFVLNYFVSDSLAGINRMSFSGKAEPIDYADLLAMHDQQVQETEPAEDDTTEPVEETEPEETIFIPDAFLKLTLSFVVEGEIVKTVPFDYGASFDESIYPDIPEKNGCYAHWDRTELENLRFDTVVTAVYESYVSSLVSSESRSNGRPVFIVQGQYDDEYSVKVSPLALTPKAFDVIPDGAWDFILSAFTASTVSNELVEQWEITIPDDGTDVHTVRYLAPDADPADLDIYLKTANGWTKLETETFGSYLSFELEELNAEIAVISKISIWWLWLIAAVLALIIVILLTRLIRKIAKPKAKPPVAVSEEAGEGEEEMMRVLPAPKAGKSKPKWLVPLLIILAFLVGIAGTAAFFLLPDLAADMETVDLLSDLAGRQVLTMELSVEAEVGRNELDFTAQIDKTQVDGKAVTCISQDNITLFYQGGTIFLENGKAYKLSQSFPDYSQLLNTVTQLYRNIEITHADKTYTITAKGENASEILAHLLPSQAAELADTNEVTVELITEEDAVSEIHFTSKGMLADKNESEFAISAVLVIDPAGLEPIQIPMRVSNEITNGNYETMNVLTEDLLLLASAWEELDGRQQLFAKLHLEANCGPIVLSENLNFYRWAGDPMVSSIQKNDYALYFTDTRICDKNGKTLPLADAPTVEAAALLDIAYRTCMNADLSSSASGGEHTFTLALNNEGMKEVAYAIAPDTAGMDIDFDNGSIQIVIRDEKIHSIKVFCNGTMKILLSDAAVSVSAEINPSDTTVEITVPDAVLEALKK